jgi:hypothetical protein
MADATLTVPEEHRAAFRAAAMAELGDAAVNTANQFREFSEQKGLRLPSGQSGAD